MGPMLLPGDEDGAVAGDTHGLAERRHLHQRAERVPARGEAAHGGVVHHDRAVRIAAVDAREMPAEYLVAVLAAEVEAPDPRSHASQLEQLSEVVDGIRDRDENAARPQHARELPQTAVELRDVVEHPGREGGVELAVLEWERLHITDARVDALRPLHLDHRLGLVDADELGAQNVDDPLGELPLAAADLEHSARLRGRDRLEGELARIVSLGVDVNRLPSTQLVWRRVLLADERRVVRRQRRAALGCGSSSVAISSRIFSSERRIRRETCICEMPTCWAICDCVSPLKKRRCRILRSRSSSTRKPGASTARSSETSYWCSSVPIDSSGSSSSPSSPPPPVDSDSELYARPDSSASSTSSSSTFAAFASSAIVGERPSCTVSCSMSRESWTFSSWSPRGTRTDQPLSRKCRLISPMMFGVAYVVSSTPRSRSKRSMALMSPIAPIWTRSSSCSPRYEYRRASDRTSDMYC